MPHIQSHFVTPDDITSSVANKKKMPNVNWYTSRYVPILREFNKNSLLSTL